MNLIPRSFCYLTLLILLAGCASQSNTSSASSLAPVEEPMPTPAEAMPPQANPTADTTVSGNTTVYTTPNASLPTSEPPSSSVPTSVETTDYVVKAGDSLWKIARDHKTSVKKLMELNQLTSDIIRPGKILKVPLVASGQP